MAKSELEIVSKMLRYKAEVEDKSYPRVVVRQLCDAVLGHNRDAVELIRQALDNQITMQDMIVRSCGMMSMYADRLDMDSTCLLYTSRLRQQAMNLQSFSQIWLLRKLSQRQIPQA